MTKLRAVLSLTFPSIVAVASVCSIAYGLTFVHPAAAPVWLGVAGLALVRWGQT